MNLRLLCVALLLTDASCTSRPAIQPAAVVPSPIEEPLSSDPYVLVSQLASRCKSIHEDMYWGADIRPKRGTAEDIDAERVAHVKMRLKEMGLDAFDALVNGIDDNRFSYSQVNAAWINYSVGTACFSILGSKVEFYGQGYKSREGANGKHAMKPFYLSHVHQTEGLKRWWEARRGRPLRELQIEALVWTIAAEKEIGFQDEKDRSRILGPLEKRLVELTSVTNP